MFIVAGIPAYNEERYIAKVILKAKNFVDKIVVIDDGSTDMTSDIAKALGAEVIRHSSNMGYGAALKTLFNYVKKLDPSILVVLDADDQHDPSDIPKLIEPIKKGKADIVIGSRFKGKTNQPLWRRLGVKFITWLTKKTHKLPHDITDVQSGYRAYSKRALHLINPEDIDMGASIDILYQSVKNGLKIIEVPVTIKHHKDSSSQNPITHASRIIFRIIELVVEKKPLLYLGFPGVIFTLMGMGSFTYVIWLFNQTRYFSVPITLISLTFIFLGMILIVASLVFFSLSKLKNKILETIGNEK